MPCGSEGKRSSLGHVCLSRRKVKSFLSSSLAQSTSVVYTGLFSSPWASVEGMGDEREGKRKREREKEREREREQESKVRDHSLCLKPEYQPKKLRSFPREWVNLRSLGISCRQSC
jgi:hypothetical protein